MTPLKISIDALAKFLLERTSAEKVYKEFPRFDEQLVLPSISLTTKRTTIIPTMKAIIATEDWAEELTTISQIGRLESSLAMDVWGKYKFSRDGLLDEILGLFLSSTINFPLESPGNPIMSVFINGSRFLDSESFSQQGVWRANIDLEAHIERIVVETVPKIKTIEAEPELNNG